MASEEGSLPKRSRCIWSKRPQREDHYQNGHTIAKWPQRHLTWSRKEGGSLPKRPHYCKTATEGGPLPKRPLYCKTASTRVTTKTATLSTPCQSAVTHVRLLVDHWYVCGRNDVSFQPMVNDEQGIDGLVWDFGGQGWGQFRNWNWNWYQFQFQFQELELKRNWIKGIGNDLIMIALIGTLTINSKLWIKPSINRRMRTNGKNTLRTTIFFDFQIIIIPPWYG